MRLRYRRDTPLERRELYDTFNYCMVLSEELDYTTESSFLDFRDDIVVMLQDRNLKDAATAITELYLMLRKELMTNSGYIQMAIPYTDLGTLFVYQSIRDGRLLSVECDTVKLLERVV